MSNGFLTKRSSVPGKIPTSSDLGIGGIGINLSDKKLFFCTATNEINEVANKADLTSHLNDTTVHLTSAQNTWIDAINASSSEINHLVGVTSAIQTQLNGKQTLNSILTSISGLATNQTGLIKLTNGSASLAAGAVVQTQHASIAAQSGTTLIPFNATPTTANGTQVASVTLTLASTSSLVEINWTSYVDVSNNNHNIVCAIFRETTCIYATSLNIATAARPDILAVHFIDSPATSGSVTYSIRIGADTATTWYIGQLSNGNNFPGVTSSTASFKELL